MVTTAWVATALFADRRTWPLIPTTLAGLGMMAAWPHLMFEITGFTAAAGNAWLGFVWHSSGKD
ncbi:hypothetical protein D3C83_134390 [compost metagenome]